MLLEKKSTLSATLRHVGNVTVVLVVDFIYRFLSFNAKSYSRLFKLFKIISQILFSSINEMSDDDRDSHIESDADKLAQNNDVEKKRRDEVEDSYNRLRDSLPAFQGDKGKATRLQIFEEAANNILSMQAKNSALQQAIDDTKSRNRILEDQYRSIEVAKATGNFAAAAAIAEEILISINNVPDFDMDSGHISDNSDESEDKPRKRSKPN